LQYPAFVYNLDTPGHRNIIFVFLALVIDGLYMAVMMALVATKLTLPRQRQNTHAVSFYCRRFVLFEPGFTI